MNYMKNIAILMGCLTVFSFSAHAAELPPGVTEQQGAAGKVLDQQSGLLRNKQQLFEEKIAKPNNDKAVEGKQVKEGETAKS